MAGFALVVFGEVSDSSSESLRPSSGHESQMSMSGGFEFSVRHNILILILFINQIDIPFYTLIFKSISFPTHNYIYKLIYKVIFIYFINKISLFNIMHVNIII